MRCDQCHRLLDDRRFQFRIDGVNRLLCRFCADAHMEPQVAILHRQAAEIGKQYEMVAPFQV